MESFQLEGLSTAQEFRRCAETLGPLVTVFALTLPLLAEADEPPFTIRGQVNAALLFGGDIADPEVVDNSASGSRLSFLANRRVFGGNAGFLRYEFQAQENSSSGAVDGGESFDTRFAEVGVDFDRWGKISLGKGAGAADGTAEISYQTSGNSLGGGHLPLITVAGTLNRDNADRGVQIGYTYYDAFGRVSRIRYDSKPYYGFQAAFSINSGDRQEFAVRYEQPGGPGLLGNLGVAKSADGENDRLMWGVGYKIRSGFSVSFGQNERTQGALNGVDRGDLTSRLLSLNYQRGKWIFSFDIGEQGGNVGNDNEVKQIGFQYQESDPLLMYAAYSKYDNADGSSLDAFFIGVRYRFSCSLMPALKPGEPDKDIRCK